MHLYNLPFYLYTMWWALYLYLKMLFVGDDEDSKKMGEIWNNELVINQLDSIFGKEAKCIY